MSFSIMFVIFCGIYMSGIMYDISGVLNANTIVVSVLNEVLDMFKVLVIP